MVITQKVFRAHEMGAEIIHLTIDDIDGMLALQVPLFKEGQAEVQTAARHEIDRLLDLRNQLALRALGLSEVELL